MQGDGGPLSAITASWQDVDKHPGESPRDRDRRVLTAWMLYSLSESASSPKCTAADHW